MAGVMPKTRYLLAKETTILGDFKSLTSIGKFFNLICTNEGTIIFNGEKQTVSYTMDQWNPSSAARNWALWEMHKNLPHGYHIYRYIV